MNETHSIQEDMPTPEEYGNFINGIQIEDVRLVELKVEAKEATINPAETALRVNDSSRFDNLSDGFEIFYKMWPGFTTLLKKKRIKSIS